MSAVDVSAAKPVEHKTKNVASVTLPRSEDGLSLVVTPSRGGVTVGVFLDLSYWQTGGTFFGGVGALGWSKSERFYLGDLQFRAPNLRVSIKVLEPGPPEIAALTTRLIALSQAPPYLA